MPKDTSKPSSKSTSKTSSKSAKPSSKASSSAKPTPSSASAATSSSLKPTKTRNPTPLAPAPKPSSAFDIDSIFSSKGTSSSSALPTAPPPAETKKKAKKKKAASGQEGMKGEGGKAKPTPIDSSRVQVVSDPSAGVGKKVEGGEVSLEVEKELDAFRNTKGGAVSTGRKTDEGFSIYKEAALGIDPEAGGDTELCPFDCECCY